MIYTGLNNTGEVEAIYGHLNGVKSEVSEVYGSIDYNDPIFYSRKTLTGTSPLTFKALGQPLKDYHIFGEAVQDGTPSPDYPVDVVGCGDRTENLFDYTDIEVGYIDPYTGYDLPDDNQMRTRNYITVQANATYTLSNYEGKCRVHMYSNDSYLGSVLSNESQYSFTTNSNCTRIRISGLKDNFIETTMLNLGSTAIPYEPYGYKIPITIGGTTTPIYIGSDPLYRIGNYADEIDFANQQIIRRVNKLVLKGTETNNYWGSGPYADGRYLLSSHSVSYDIVVGYGYCSHFALKYAHPDHLAYFNNVFSPYTSELFWFSGDNRYKSISAWKTWIVGEYNNGTPLTVWYVLGTPETTSITIPALTTITGDNTLTIDTTVKPSAVSITGHIKPTGYGQLLDVNDVDIQDSTGEPIYIQG